MLKILASGIIGLHCTYNFEVLFFVLLKHQPRLASYTFNFKEFYFVEAITAEIVNTE